MKWTKMYDSYLGKFTYEGLKWLEKNIDRTIVEKLYFGGAPLGTILPPKECSVMLGWEYGQRTFNYMVCQSDDIQEVEPYIKIYRDCYDNPCDTIRKSSKKWIAFPEVLKEKARLQLRLLFEGWTAEEVYTLTYGHGGYLYRIERQGALRLLLNADRIERGKEDAKRPVEIIITKEWDYKVIVRFNIF